MLMTRYPALLRSIVDVGAQQLSTGVMAETTLEWFVPKFQNKSGILTEFPLYITVTGMLSVRYGERFRPGGVTGGVV